MPDQGTVPDIDAREYGDLCLADLRRLYGPADDERIPRLRERILDRGGLDSVLASRDTDPELRQSVLRQLRFESLVELGLQARIISFTPGPSELVGDLFSRRHPSFYRLTNRWLPLLLAARLRSNYRYDVGREKGQIAVRAASMFIAIVNLDATLHRDVNLQVLSQLLVHGQAPGQPLLQAAFLHPERFVRMWLDESDAALANAERGNPIRGLTRFIYLCRELSEILGPSEDASHFRAAVWQFHAGCFEQFLPTAAFAHALALSRSALASFDEWTRITAVHEGATGATGVGLSFTGQPAPIEGTDEDVKHDSEALERLVPERYTPPQDWLRVVSGGVI